MSAVATRSSRVPTLGSNVDKRVAVHGVRRVVVLSDLQIPFEDADALAQAEAVARRVKPDLIVLAGDVIDCYAESEFVKDPVLALRSIPETHERVRALMKRLSFAPLRVWLGGNHEDRWRKVLWSNTSVAKQLVQQHQAVAGVPLNMNDPVGSFRALYGVYEHGWAYYPYGHRLYLAEGSLVITHGKYVSRHSGYSARRTWEWLGRSCIVGHTHRLGTYLITQDGVPVGAWENGCLCQLEPEYDDAPNWQQGFSIVRIDGSTFHVVQVPIVRRDGKPVAVYRGGV